MKKNKKILKLIYFIDSFWNTNISFFFFIFLVFIVGTTQIILFQTGITPISGIEKNSSLEWVAWLYLVISIPGTLSAFFAEIYTIRISKNFFYWSLFSEFISIITLVLGGMIWTSFIVFISFFINLYRFNLIKKNGKDYEINEKKVLIFSSLFLVFLLLTGLILININTFDIIWWNPSTTKLIKYLDVICSVNTLLGMILLLTKNKYAYLIFMFSDILFIFAFIYMSQWLTAVQITVYSLINILGIFGWSIKDKYPNVWNKQH